jgi:hypothetical protein
MIFTNNQKQMVTQVPVPNSYSTAFSARYMRAHPPVNPNPVLRTPPAVVPTTRHVQPASVTRNAISQQRAPVEPVPKPKLMKWGQPTWTMFHTIAEKIKPELYPRYRGELLHIIKTISNTLPCPICATHATQYTKGITEAHLATKADFQNMLWEFHNSVNQRKGLPIFPYEKLHATYSSANTRVVLQNFIEVHSDKHAGFRLVADDFYRNRIINFLRSWFINNIHAFNE